MRRALITTAFFAALIGLWKAGTLLGGWSPVLLPPPEAVAEYLPGCLAGERGRLARQRIVRQRVPCRRTTRQRVQALHHRAEEYLAVPRTS